MHQLWDNIIEPLLKAADAKMLTEIGIGQGATTAKLLAYAERVGGIVHGIDPAPLFDAEQWQRKHRRTFILHRKKSLDVLPHLKNIDAFLIDGDHNWYSVLHELRAIEKNIEAGRPFPIIFLHDTSWPYGRRDRYDDPSQIPEKERQPSVQGGLLPAVNIPQ